MIAAVAARATRATGWLAGALSVLPCPAAGQTGEPPAAIGAQRLLSSVEGRPCPALGERSYVAGMASPDELAAAADREMASARASMRTLERLIGDPEVSDKGRGDLVSLGSWTVAQSLANWTLLRLAQQALVDPQVAANQPFPTDVSASTENTLAQFAAARALIPNAVMLIGRLRDATARCGTVTREAIMAANEPAIRSAIEGARTPDELRQVDALYRLRRGGGRAALLAMYDDRMRVITPRIARVPSAPPPASGPSQAQLATARRFVAAASRQDRAAALAELTDDVQLSTPQGSYSGKTEVSQMVAQQSANGSSGSLSPPQISGDRVVSAGRASGFNVVTRFEFSGNKISRITVRLA